MSEDDRRPAVRRRLNGLARGHGGVVRVGLGWLFGLAVLSCSGGEPTGEASGTAQISLSSVPADVLCVKVQVTGARSLVKSVPVVPGGRGEVVLGGLAIGTSVFTADAFSVACEQVGAGVDPSWIGTPVSATLVPGVVAEVTIELRRNGRARVGLVFDDDPDAGAADAGGTDAGTSGADAVSSDDGGARRDGSAVDDAGALSDGAAVDDAALADDGSATGDVALADDGPTPADGALACGPRINEVQVAGAAGAADEFVELVNTCPTPLPLTSVRLVYRSAAGTTDVVLVSDLSPFTLAPGGHLLLTGSGYGGSAGDGTFSAGLAAAGGGLALRRGQELLDSLGYGTATNAFVEGHAAAAPPSGRALARLPDGADQDDNAADFQVTAPTPGATNH